MAKYRQSRLNDSVAQEVSLILRDVKDPRVSGGMLTVTGAEVTTDLKYAKIYYSILGEEDDLKETERGLRSAAGFIRSQLARRLNMRITPELSFVFDRSVRHGAHIAEVLNRLDIPADIGTEDAHDSDGE